FGKTELDKEKRVLIPDRLVNETRVDVIEASKPVSSRILFIQLPTDERILPCHPIARLNPPLPSHLRLPPCAMVNGLSVMWTMGCPMRSQSIQAAIGMFFQVAYYMYMTGPRYRPTLRVTSNGLNSAFREKKYGYLFDLYPLL
ncbi:cytochrome P450, partial [Striga asiatica]